MPPTTSPDTDPADQDATPRCTICHKPARDRYHNGCAEHLDNNLTNLPTLYTDLEAALIPARGIPLAGHATGSKNPPIPANLHVLNLRSHGGIAETLTRWEGHVREALGWTHTPWRGNVQQTITGSAAFLRANLPWICEQDAAHDFAREIASLTGQATAAVTGERGERPLKVLCATEDCGGILRITLSCDGRRCPRCQTPYTHDELLSLDLAARAAA